MHNTPTQKADGSGFSWLFPPISVVSVFEHDECRRG
jgi:hypothetical protein